MKMSPQLVLAALLTSAPLGSAWSASCCGGGSASTLILPKYFSDMVDVSFAYEQYDGYWNQQGKWTPDPVGSSLNQYRLTLGYAHRFGDHWQGSISLPYVINDNQYSGLDAQTDDIGDMQVSLWYEAFDGIMCVTQVKRPKDLLPAAYLGLILTVPTGVSPYDEVDNNFDITGRGMYRLDAALSLEKSIGSWNAVIKTNYGKYLKRDVNREYGKYVAPYSAQLGDRKLVSGSIGYSQLLETMDSVTYTLAYAYLSQNNGEIAGNPDPSSAFNKKSVTGSLAYATLSRHWVYRFSWNHSLADDDKGRNFPTTDIVTIGVSHVFE